MKRFLIISVLFVLVAMSVLPCMAATVHKPDKGIAYIISDNWYDMGNMLYENKNNSNETFKINVSDYPFYVIDQVSDEELKAIAEKAYSDEYLAAVLKKRNKIDVTVAAESVLWRNEYHGGKKYFRYEKSYTARAKGFNDTPFYFTAFVTVQNGKLYIIEYTHNYKTNNFKDITYMLSTMSYEYGMIKITVNGEFVTSDREPVIVNDRTMVPIRAVAEKMGYSVTWNEEKQAVNMTSAQGDHILEFVINSNTATKNNESVELDTAPIIIGGRTYLPVRAVAEAMNAKVDWNGAQKTVVISY